MPDNKNLARKRLTEFLRGSLSALNPFQSKVPQPEPAANLPLTLRVGVTGHLDLVESPALHAAVASTFAAIQRAANAVLPDFQRHLPGRGQNSAVEVRLISSLAAGADQIVARIALESGCTLHAVLPFSREDFAVDIGSAHPLTELLGKAQRVLELDGSLACRPAAYEAASETLVANSDILLVLADSARTETKPGGTRWTQQHAKSRGVRTLEIATDHPATPGDDITQVVRTLVLTPATKQAPLHDSGWFETRFRRSLDPHWNAAMWGDRWNQFPKSPIDSAVREQIDGDYKATAVWADHRASAYGMLSRGGFVLVALLGALAVALALSSPLGVWGKMTEVAVVFLALAVQIRSHGRHWRERWLSYRELERRLAHAGYLSLIGRGSQTRPPAAHTPTHHPARRWWVDWYLNAVLRTAAFPDVKLTPEYLARVDAMMRRSLIALQIDYFKGELFEHEYTGEWLERWSKRALMTALLVTGAYVVLHWIDHFFPQLELEHLAHEVKTVASVCGALFPAIAGALAAMRAYGEYTQHTARYGNMIDILEVIAARSPGGLTSSTLATLGHDTAAVLADEVHAWRVILAEKQIEL